MHNWWSLSSYFICPCISEFSLCFCVSDGIIQNGGWAFATLCKLNPLYFLIYPIYRYLLRLLGQGGKLIEVSQMGFNFRIVAKSHQPFWIMASIQQKIVFRIIENQNIIDWNYAWFCLLTLYLLMGQHCWVPVQLWGYHHVIAAWNTYFWTCCIQQVLAATKQLYEWSCPSVCHPFSLCSCYHMIMNFSGVITIDKSGVHAKGQAQRSKVQFTEVKIIVP